MVSIIIPSFNNLKHLKKCVASIQNQRFKNYEVWIIDNQSTDGTLAYLKKLEAPFHWISEKDNGVYDAMNKGISLTNKEWLYFLGADDQLYNENVLNTVFNKPISNVFTLIIGVIRYDLKENDIVYTHTKDGQIKPSWSFKLWLKNSVHHQAIFYNKEAFKNRSYELKYKILADHALNLSLYRASKKAKIINEIIAICGTDGLSKNYSREMYLEEVQLKIDQSSRLLKPLFILMANIKYYIKANANKTK